MFWSVRGGLCRVQDSAVSCDVLGLKDGHSHPPTLSPWETVERRALLLCRGSSVYKVSRKEVKRTGGAVQVDRSRKQHLYEIYCLQIQMVEGLGGGEEGVVGTVQLCCLIWRLVYLNTVRALPSGKEGEREKERDAGEGRRKRGRRKRKRRRRRRKETRQGREKAKEKRREEGAVMKGVKERSAVKQA
ncbi:unnamed protein product [Pleuronectes platessa]|uniref:Uncharacterized protein n=1 Tax=Pleuronectes platessa TaxID=8262 RepID=A0A9N7VDA2_PLEPL|nr:unnamed protein product [Pleuronectes platessa]